MHHQPAYRQSRHQTTQGVYEISSETRFHATSGGVSKYGARPQIIGMADTSKKVIVTVVPLD